MRSRPHGPAKGMTFGRHRLVDGPVAADVPLGVALHGGTYTSVYFDIPGQSLLESGAARHPDDRR